MIKNRALRSLDHLNRTGSTARVLNLCDIAKRNADDPDYIARPLFSHPDLNRAMIVKHRLRDHELNEFQSPRTTATKIMTPVDAEDLRKGARYLFVGQRGFDELLVGSFGARSGLDSNDYRILALLDEVSSLDPFLLRGLLRRNGLEPAPCYFDLSPGDSRAMLAFTQKEIEPLVRRSMGFGQPPDAYTRKLAQKILANAADSELDPLRRTLQLEPADYQEGIFCWKAFLYYKWSFAQLLPQVAEFSREIETARPRGVLDHATRECLQRLRSAIRAGFVSNLKGVNAALCAYDEAYLGLSQSDRPLMFREFLIRAPSQFQVLGERLGALQHALSFWRFRFPPKLPSVAASDELIDIFTDFIDRLTAADAAAAQGEDQGGGREPLVMRAWSKPLALEAMVDC